MIPGEIFPADGNITLNDASTAITIMVANTGDRPVQVGSHYHFAESNPALEFERTTAHGMRLDIAAGTAVRFEPGQRREVTLVPLSGARKVFGFNGEVMGEIDVISDVSSDSVEQMYTLLNTLIRLHPLHVMNRSEDLPMMASHGVYFMFHPDEMRSKRPHEGRVVRIGKSDNLAVRLRQHMGDLSGAGSHRSSILRKHIGRALIQRDQKTGYRNWDEKKTPPKEILTLEKSLERLVSNEIGQFLFTWVGTKDSDEALNVERNSIALLSNIGRVEADRQSSEWLGKHSASVKIQQSGLWNDHHTTNMCDPNFMRRFSDLINSQKI